MNAHPDSEQPRPRVDVPGHAKRGGVVMLVIGIILTLLGFPAAMGGAGLASAAFFDQRDDGFVTTPRQNLHGRQLCDHLAERADRRRG